MAKQKEIKTNAMHILESMKIPFEAHTYECDEFIDAIHIADMLQQPYEKMYKTLVTQGNSKNYFVFVIPIDEELDLKKAARSVGEKNVARAKNAGNGAKSRVGLKYRTKKQV